jgi:predicted dehydrogenase
MGPYYLTALVQLLGQVVSVEARTLSTGRRRTVGKGPRAGDPVTVEVPTYAAAVLRHDRGALSTVTLSFETWGRPEPCLELFGTKGALRLPDPNRFDGAPLVYDATGVTNSDQEAAVQWRPAPVQAGFVGAGRGVGLLDMAESIRDGRAHRASGDLALHVLEVMEAITHSRGETQALTTSVAPAPVVKLRGLGA